MKSRKKGGRLRERERERVKGSERKPVRGGKVQGIRLKIYESEI